MIPDNIYADIGALEAALETEGDAYQKLADAQAAVSGLPAVQAEADAARVARAAAVTQLQTDLDAWHMAGPVTLLAAVATRATATRSAPPGQSPQQQKKP